jgi:flagellin
MSYRINTNITAMNAHVQSSMNNRDLNSSLEKLSSGLRINKAADDASGLAIADNLRSQSNALGQAISNANDGIGIIQIADKAMDEQIKILDTIKTKATQAAQDGQSTESRQAIQSDIKQLLEELDNISNTTSYNGKQLLSGNFVNKEFQVGAYSRETVKASINATNSDKIGHIRMETTANGGIDKAGISTLTFTGNHIPGGQTTIESVEIDSKAGTGIGVLAEAINKNSDKLGLKASYKVESTGSQAIGKGNINNLTINNVKIGDIQDIKANDSDGRLVSSINSVKDETGVTASVDGRGHLTLTSTDGRAIEIKSGAEGTNADGSVSVMNSLKDVASVEDGFNGGRLTLISKKATDILVADKANGALDNAISNSVEDNMNLRGVLGGFSANQADAMGSYSNENAMGFGNSLTAGVTTREGAMSVMDIADSAITQLDSIRSNLGSIQNKFVATINNISVTQVNVKSAESTIRDVDFAQESSNFSKANILAQSGSYALSQSNAVQQNVLRLLQ